MIEQLLERELLERLASVAAAEHFLARLSVRGFHYVGVDCYFVAHVAVLEIRRQPYSSMRGITR